MYKKLAFTVIIFFVLIMSGCSDKHKSKENMPQTKIEKLLLNYADVKLNANLDVLTVNQKKMIPYLFEAAQLIDELFWIQTYGKKEQLFKCFES